MIKKIIMMVSVAVAVVIAQADRIDTPSECWIDPETGILWKYRINGASASIKGDTMETEVFQEGGFSSTEYYISSAVSDDVSGAITVPSTLGGCPVTSIEENAFRGCSSLTSVKIPDSVTSIGYRAFYGCSSLTSITIPDSVTSIESYAFLYCSSLKEVHISDLAKWCNIKFGDIYANPFYYADNLCLNGMKVTQLEMPDGVTSIGSYAFYGCSSLTSVTIPDSVTSIANSAFHGCSSLIEFIVSTDNKEYMSKNGLLLSKDGKTLILGVNGVVTIPDSVTSIGAYAFLDCSSLTSVTIPDSVISIGRSAFSDCSSLTSVTIPDSVTSIGGAAFGGCYSLASVTIGNGVTSIESIAFSCCSSLKEVHISDLAKWCNIEFVYGQANPLYYADNLYLNGIKVTSLVIPNGVTSIGDYAFSGCSSLTSVTIPNSVTSIGDYTFSGCDSLTSITIPDSVTSVGEDAFEGCSSIKTATLPGWDCGITLDQVTNIVISAGTKIVRAEGFSGCTSLESVSMPEGVTQIDSNAFSGCSSLKTVLIPDSVTYIQGSAFDGTPFGGKIYTETVKLVSQKLSDDSTSQGGSSGSGDEGGAAVTPPVNADLGYNLTESVEDRSISNVEINGDRALDEFVLKDGKVYDCVLRIVNVSDNAAKVILPKKYVYEKFRGTNPLLIPAASTNLLTITRTKADTFFISREELALEVQE